MLSEFKKNKLKAVEFAHKRHGSWLQLVIMEERRGAPVHQKQAGHHTPADRPQPVGHDVVQEATLSSTSPALEDDSRLNLQQQIVAVSWSPDATLLAVGFHDGLVSVFGTRPEWPPRDWELPQRLGTTHVDSASTLRFSPCGTRLAVGSWDRSISIVSIPCWTVAGKLENLHEDLIMTLGWRPDATQLAVGSADGTMSLVLVQKDAQTHKDVVIPTGRKIVNGEDITVLAWSPDGSKLALGSDDMSVIIVNTATWETVTRVEIDGIGASVVCLGWEPRGLSRLAVGFSDGFLTMLDTRSWRVMWSKDCSSGLGKGETTGRDFMDAAPGTQIDAVHDRVAMRIDWDVHGDCEYILDMTHVSKLNCLCRPR